MTKNLLSICLLLTLSQFTLSGQTAHAGATAPVGSGFSFPAAVAVDQYGDVFVTGRGVTATAGTVYEIVAVNGVVSATNC